MNNFSNKGINKLHNLDRIPILQLHNNSLPHQPTILGIDIIPVWPKIFLHEDNWEYFHLLGGKFGEQISIHIIFYCNF